MFYTIKCVLLIFVSQSLYACSDFDVCQDTSALINAVQLTGSTGSTFTLEESNTIAHKPSAQSAQYLCKKNRHAALDLHQILVKIANNPSKFYFSLKHFFKKHPQLMHSDLRQIQTQISLSCNDLLQAVAHIDSLLSVETSRLAIMGIIQIGAFIHSPHCPREKTLKVLAKLYPPKQLLVQYLPKIFKVGYLLQYIKDQSLDFPYDLHNLRGALKRISKKHPTLKSLIKFFRPFARHPQNPLASICKGQTRLSDLSALVISPCNKDDIACIEVQCCPLSAGINCKDFPEFEKLCLKYKKLVWSQTLSKSSKLLTLEDCLPPKRRHTKLSTYSVSVPLSQLHDAPEHTNVDNYTKRSLCLIKRKQNKKNSYVISFLRASFAPMSYFALPSDTAKYLQLQLNNILQNPNQAFDIIKAIHTEAMPTECDPSCTTIYSMLSSMIDGVDKDQFPTQHLGLVAIGELCSFILEGHPAFSLLLLEALQSIYLQTALHPNVCQKSAYHIRLSHTRVLIKLTYALQNIMINLLHNTSTLQELLKELDIDEDNAEEALKDVFSLLNVPVHSLLSPSFQKGFATLLCKKQNMTTTVLSTLQYIEQNQGQQLLIPFVNPYVSDPLFSKESSTKPLPDVSVTGSWYSTPSLDPNVSCIPYICKETSVHSAVYNSVVKILDDPTLAQTVVYSRCLDLGASPSADDSVSNMIEQTLQRFVPYVLHDPEVGGLAALAELYNFCIATPPLNRTLVHIMSNIYPLPHQGQGGGATKKIRHIRQLIKLSYVLQNLIPEAEVEQITTKAALQRYLCDLKLNRLTLNQSLRSAFNQLPPSITSNINATSDPGAATRSCRPFCRINDTLFFLQDLESRQHAVNATYTRES